MKLTIFDPRIIRMTEVCNAFLDDGSVFFQSDYSYFPRFYIFGVVCAVDTNTHTFGLAHWNAFDCILWRPPDKGYGSGIGTDIVGIIHAILSKLSRWCAEGFIQSWLKAINEFCNWKFFLWLCKQF